MPISHLELFSGIGGFRKAFDFLEKDFKLKTKCVGFSEIDQNATKTYKANYDTSKEVEIGDIVSFVQNKKNVESLPDFNFLTGGFPCQSFSMMGKQKGFNDLRGNVFFQIIDIINIKKPSFVLLENVRNLKSHNNGKTLEVVISFIKNAGYKYIYYDVFNTENFGLAQKRNRVYIFATNKKPQKDFIFNENIVKQSFEEIKSKISLLKQKSVIDVLEKNVDKKYYLSEIIKPTILSDGTKNFKSKSEIDTMLAKPLTATMVKMHRACQDNYFSDDFINSKNPLEFSKLIFSKDDLVKKAIRKITPKEALALQGFNEDFYLNACKEGISDHQLFKQAGNAVSVNTVYAILYYLLIINKFN